MKIPKELLEASEYVFLQKNGLELTLFSGLLVKIPEELLHAGGAAGKVGTAETALLQLGPEDRMLGVRLDIKQNIVV